MSHSQEVLAAGEIDAITNGPVTNGGDGADGGFGVCAATPRSNRATARRAAPLAAPPWPNAQTTRRVPDRAITRWSFNTQTSDSVAESPPTSDMRRNKFIQPQPGWIAG